ncbi:alpha/beta hydrolase [Massilia cavernae]|uniref:Alpha/beta hydrolase n=1 Tax=Massilia cavernae TaxID=2320864 RepID=A0A418XSC2_9BURK|nr:alpha/beta hydrolase-fold protein [Massilia cavernae]RJG15467.1 alpha/beta hydrolase [Massilia cavernae]
MPSIIKPVQRIRFGLLIAAFGAAAASAADIKPAAAVRPSTALPGVSVLPVKLDIPGLDRKRQLRLYLPPGYATSGKRYPVLYMHDGQNLFDNATSYASEWKVDETLDALAKEGKLELIVVGIDNGEQKRMTELNAWSSERFGQAEGKQYMDFIVKVVKPTIDKEYRTLPDRANTAVMGSSMGGLISHYAINEYPDVFSKAGVFSPAYWTAVPVFDFVNAKPAPKDARVYMLMGSEEGESMVPDAERMAALLVKTGHPTSNLSMKVVPGAKHNEGFWSGEFRDAVLWMFKPGSVQTVSAKQ